LTNPVASFYFDETQLQSGERKKRPVLAPPGQYCQVDAHFSLKFDVRPDKKDI